MGEGNNKLEQQLVTDTTNNDNMFALWVSQLRQRQSQICQRELRKKPNIINVTNLALENFWDNFISSISWHEEIKFKLELIHNNINLINARFDTILNTNPYKKFLQNICTTNLELSYIEIVDGLEKSINDRLFQNLLSYIYGIEKNIRENGNEDDKNLILQLHQSLIDLRGLISSPKFKKCFLLLGSLGSGKTQFVYNLINKSIYSFDQDHNKYRLLVIHLQFFDGNTLENAILTEIKKFSGIESWKSLDEFSDYLHNKKIDIKLVIVIDNLHKLIVKGWGKNINFKNELINFISEKTDLHCLYWVISLIDTNYDQIVDKKTSKFWEQYSFLDNTVKQITKSVNNTNNIIYETIPCIGGWIYLDYLNYSQQLGINLLKKHTEEHGNQPHSFFSNEILHNITKNSYVYYISNPFIAWIIIDSSNSINLENLVLLNFAEFINLFQETILEEIDEIGKNTYDYYSSYVHPYIQNIVSFLIYQPNFSCCFQELLLDLLNKICQSQSEIYFKRIERLFSLFSDVNLIAKNSPAIECVCNESISLLFEPFWLWQFAQIWLLSHKNSETETNIINQLEALLSTFPQHLLKEEILIFILLLLEQSKSETDKLNSSFSNEIYNVIIKNPNFPTSAAWLSGTRTNIEVQKLLVSWAYAHSGSINDKRVLFSFIYFISQNQILSIPERFRLLKDYYLKKINSFDLSDYFLFSAKFMLSQIQDLGELQKALGYLCDCEYINDLIPIELAKFSMNKILDLCKEDMNIFLESMLTCLTFINETEAELSSHRWRFREWILNEFCRILMDFEGMNGFLMLIRVGWFNRKFKNLQFLLLIEMKREASSAIGYYYRNFEDNPDLILANLKLLIDKKQYKSACFVIYHTLPTSSHSDTGQGRIIPIIDTIFHPLLVEIKSNLNSQDLNYFQDFFTRNNI